MVNGAVRNTVELRRILALPERDADAIGEHIAEPLTALLRRPGGTMTLRPLQALALAEAHDRQGAVIMLPVGYGKTLVSFLLPRIFDDVRKPLLLVPAKLREKTRIEFRELAEHWQGANNLEVLSYEMISTRPGVLDEIAPDMIIADECHKLKNPKAGVTKRVYRYCRNADNMIFVPLSGTITTRSFVDWWHLQFWALGPERSVLPTDFRETTTWAEALDEKMKIRRPPGALEVFADQPEHGHLLNKIRDGYGRKIRSVEGVISAHADELGISLTLALSRFEPSSAVKEALKNLIETWTLPDGTELIEAVDFWRHAVELSQGFYYTWADDAPEDWLEARAGCSKYVRGVLSRSRTLDTPAQVLKERLDDQRVKNWLVIRDTFKPITKPTWLCKELLQKVATFPGLIWVGHTAVGEELEQNYKIPFYREEAKTRSGRHIYDHTEGPAAVSIAACSEGLNLQTRFYQNLITAPSSNGARWEQLLGRTHRQGQREDEVQATVLVHTQTTLKNFEQARADAKYIERITGQKQKLNLADYTEIEHGKLF
jgi:hypothetical protein